MDKQVDRRAVAKGAGALTGFAAALKLRRRDPEPFHVSHGIANA